MFFQDKHELKFEKYRSIRRKGTIFCRSNKEAIPKAHKEANGFEADGSSINQKSGAIIIGPPLNQVVFVTIPNPTAGQYKRAEYKITISIMRS